ncbi:Glycosyltransferase involved in cell wall bisynthesis [Cyclonatronum proteinivorum]|uniref:Glycosyltransferase involved in cell wall bisynthesis n=1 Tax=Cyclonatronum proteinivorum TaxID=1457365 RepID=A0A345UQ01_9BACT|nr:glycosyltransferase [Cyclonatronum proteinivorum]AXJ02553.1 Glycosyltransferase involved in cell wall bisynthesis [Cyclonatronum proteinivorum]
MTTSSTVLILASSRSVHTLRWATGMQKLGWQIQLLTADPDEPHDYGSIPVHRLKHSGRFTYLRSVGLLRKLHKKINPSLVHAFYATNYGLLAVLARVRPLLLSVMGTDVFSYPQKSYFHLMGTSAILKRADCVAATSQVMVRRVKWFRGGPESVVHTPFGVDLSRFKPDPQAQTQDESRPFRIVSVRHLEYKYGLDVLIEAAALIHRQHSWLRFSLDMYGEGAERAALEAQIEANGLTGIARLPGPLEPERIPEVLQRADVAVVPSREESFGVAVLEASACGLPVIGSKVGGIPEVLKEGETGLLFPRQNVAALESCLLRIASEPYTRQRFGVAGRRFVEATYSEDACLQRMHALYTQLTQ